jgi:hypothetical protein
MSQITLPSPLHRQQQSTPTLPNRRKARLLQTDSPFQPSDQIIQITSHSSRGLIVPGGGQQKQPGLEGEQASLHIQASRWQVFAARHDELERIGLIEWKT